MSVSDFLFNGSAPASTSSYGQTTANLPQWYNDFLQGVAAKGNAIAAEPFQVYGQPRVAGFNQDQNNAFQATRDMQGAWQPTLQNGVSAVQGATQNTAGAAASPFLGSAAGLSATQAAAPLVGAASGTFTGGNVQSYMNPWIQNVADNATTMAARGLNEKLIPAIGNDFVKAGQYGSTRMMGEVGNALRDTTEGLTNQIGNLYAQGYNSAQGAFTSDQNRLAGLAGTVGNLTNSEQGNLGSLGQVAGNLQNADNSTAISAGSKLGDLATTGQTLGLKDAAALQAVGNQQQNQTQQNLDVAYQDFQNQTNYPKDQLSWLNSLIKGYNPGSQTTSTQTQTAPSKSGSTNLGTITGGLSALLGAFSGNAKGGLIKKKAPDPDMDGDVDSMAQAAMDFDNDVRSGALGRAKPSMPPARRTGLAGMKRGMPNSKPKGGLSAMKGRA